MLKKIMRKLKKKFCVKIINTEKIPVTSSSLLAGKVALITGASEGIGFGIAEAFIKAGGFCVITGRNEEKLKIACTKLGKNCSDYIVWDASDISQINRNLELLTKKTENRLDILVNNAGYHGNQNFWTISEKDYDDTFNVNIKNVFFLSQAVAKYMIENKIEGHICNITSASSAKPAWSPYEISKWACRGFTKGLAREVVQYGLTVNGIAPGPCATSMSNWKEGDSIAWEVPKGRLAMPEEIGNLAVFLCSDLGNNIIGETVFCDGGSGTISTNR